MLAVLAAVHPAAARAMAEYRIVADVLWAARRYADWTGDTALFDGPGRELLLDTRYWASRARWDDDGLAHIEQGHRPRRVPRGVDDNAYTNVMARWNLRRAAELAERAGGATPDEIQAWRRLAGALVDGYDPATGRYRQFAGFDELEPLLLGELTRPPSPPTCCSASSGSGRPRWSSRPTCPCSICWFRRRRHPEPWRPTWPITAPAPPTAARCPRRCTPACWPGRATRSGRWSCCGWPAGWTWTTSPAPAPAACTWPPWAGSGRP